MVDLTVLYGFLQQNLNKPYGETASTRNRKPPRSWTPQQPRRFRGQCRPGGDEAEGEGGGAAPDDDKKHRACVEFEGHVEDLLRDEKCRERSGAQGKQAGQDTDHAIFEFRGRNT
jgi:hypothetical protein